MIKSLLFSPLSFFEKLSPEKIITRLSNDLSINDKVITSEFNYLLVYVRLLILALFSIYYVFISTQSYLYISGFTSILAGCLYYFSKFYGFSSRIQNLERDLLVSVNGMYSELIDGLPTIRAYKRVEPMFANFSNKIGTFSSASLIRTIVDAKLVLNILICTNVLAIIKVMSLLFIEEPFQQFSIFLIVNIFLLEDAVLRVNHNIVTFAPLL